jgi:hypothetical protein
MGTKGVPPVAFAKKLKDAQPSEEELKTASFHLAVDKELYELETYNAYQPLPGDPGYDSGQELKLTFEIGGYPSDCASDISMNDDEYLKANHVYLEDEEPYLVPLYVDEEDLRESLLDDPEKKLNAQQYALHLAYKTMLNDPDYVYRYPNSRLTMVRDKEGEHRRHRLDGTFAQSAAEEKRVFNIIWSITKEYFDSMFVLARNVTIIYDFGDANPLRVVIDVPRSLGTTLYEFVERYVGTMFNQPVIKFRISLNGKKFSDHRLYKCSYTLVNDDVVTITPKELGLMGGGRHPTRHTKSATVLDALELPSSDDDEKQPIDIQALPPTRSRIVNTTTTTTISLSRSQARVKHSNGVVFSQLKRLAVEPRKKDTVDWSHERDRSSTSSTTATPMVINAEVSNELPYVDSFRDEDTDCSVTFNDFSQSNSESSSTIASSSQDSNGPIEAVTEDQRKALKLFGARCRTEVNKLHQRMAHIAITRER